MIDMSLVAKCQDRWWARLAPLPAVPRERTLPRDIEVIDRHQYRGAHLFFSSRRRHTSCLSDWSSDVCSSDLCLRPASCLPEATVEPEREGQMVQSVSAYCPLILTIPYRGRVCQALSISRRRCC